MAMANLVALMMFFPVPFGSPAVLLQQDPLALRPRLAAGLPLSAE
jgi:hypothetical protein